MLVIVCRDTCLFCPSGRHSTGPDVIEPFLHVPQLIVALELLISRVSNLNLEFSTDISVNRMMSKKGPAIEILKFTSH